MDGLDLVLGGWYVTREGKEVQLTRIDHQAIPYWCLAFSDGTHRCIWGGTRWTGDSHVMDVIKFTGRVTDYKIGETLREMTDRLIELCGGPEKARELLSAKLNQPET